LIIAGSGLEPGFYTLQQMKLSMDMDEFDKGEEGWFEKMITPHSIRPFKVSGSGSWSFHVLQRASFPDIVTETKPAADWIYAIIDNRILCIVSV